MSSAVCEVPVELACLAIQWTRLQRALVDADDRHQLRIVAGGEDLIRVLEIRIAKRAFDNWHACIAQQLDGAMTRDTAEERAVRGRSIDHPVLGEEDIRGGKLGDIAEHVAEQ